MKDKNNNKQGQRQQKTQHNTINVGIAITGYVVLTESISPSAPRGVLNSPSRGQIFDMMPRTTSLLSGKAMMSIACAPRVRAIIARK